MMVAVNLIPESVLSARTRRRHIVRWVTSLGLGLAALALCAASDWVQRGELRSMRDKRERLRAEMTQATAEFHAVTVAANDAHLRVERARALRSKRPWSGMLALIASQMPEGSWLTTVATDPSVPSQGTRRQWVSGDAAGKPSDQPLIMQAPRRLKIGGFTPNAGDPYEFVTLLKEAQVFSAVALRTSQREPVYDGSYYRFELVCEW